MTQTERWRNRVVGQRLVDPHELEPHVLNWRRHPEDQRRALLAALGEVGWVQPVLVNRRTGRLIDGHLRVVLALDEGESVVPVTEVDLDEGEERLALATLDAISRMAVTDDGALVALLAQIDTEDDDLREFLADLDPEDDDLTALAQPVIPDVSREPPPERQLQLVLSVTAEQRDTITGAIERFVREWPLADDPPTPGEALAQICYQWWDLVHPE